MTTPLFLVADVGGTNTRVGLARGTDVDIGSVRRYRNTDFSGLDVVLRDYLDATGAAPDAAAAAGAGPVEDGIVRLTNLDWTVAPDCITDATGCATVSVLNDLQAQGHALPFIQDSNLTRIMPGTATPGPDATRLVIGLGTGVNAALVLQVNGLTVVPPSETGHIDLPVVTADQADLADWLRAEHGFAAVEEALSGRGLTYLYAWACDRAGIANTLGKDSTAIMTAIGTADPTALKAGHMYASLLGTLSASLALIQLPFGGIYFAGGMSRAFAPMLDDFGFTAAFRNQGRFSDYMTQFSALVVEDDYAALTGCAAHLVSEI